jgi:energy-converting hydrogenase Eha subunit F
MTLTYLYLIRFVSDLRQVGVFLSGIAVSSTNKAYRHNITEILLKVALNTINKKKTIIRSYKNTLESSLLLVIITTKSWIRCQSIRNTWV